MSQPNYDLMAELERRVAEKRAAGLYSIDALFDGRQSHADPFRADEIVELARLAEVTPDMGLAISTKPGVGKAVGVVKQQMVRATSQPLMDLADRTSAFNLALLSLITEMAQELTALRAQLSALQADPRPMGNRPE